MTMAPTKRTRTMSRRSTRIASALAPLAVATLAACTPFKVKAPPDGFVEVNDSDYLHRYKALDNVGMNIRAFDNHKGGTIEYWAGDLLNKLGEREYTKTGESKIVSGNGVQGTRYDFDYTPPGREDEAEMRKKFYTAALFVTKKHIVVIELAGDHGLADAYRKRIENIASELKVR